MLSLMWYAGNTNCYILTSCPTNRLKWSVFFIMYLFTVQGRTAKSLTLHPMLHYLLLFAGFRSRCNTHISVGTSKSILSSVHWQFVDHTLRTYLLERGGINTRTHTCMLSSPSGWSHFIWVGIQLASIDSMSLSVIRCCTPPSKKTTQLFDPNHTIDFLSFGSTAFYQRFLMVFISVLLQVLSRGWLLEFEASVTVWAPLSTVLSSTCSTWSWPTRTAPRPVLKPTWPTPPTR